MPFIQIATPFNIDIEFELAAIHKRLLAYCIDFSIIIIYLLSMLYFLFGAFTLGESNMGIIFLVLLVPTILYTVTSETIFMGQTAGKKIMQIKVVSLDGGEPTFGQYLLRWFLRFYEWGFIVFFLFWLSGFMGVIILLFGGVASIIIMMGNKKSQRLGDIVAGTVVVATASALTVADTIFMEVVPANYIVNFPEVMKLSDRDINTIKNVLQQAKKNNKYDMCNKVAVKVQQVLQVPTNLFAVDFLEKILADYNYLAITNTNK
jgi:uncharacterized RDD family membrane protein YckC